MTEKEENLKVATILATIASFFLIASGLFISNAESATSRLSQLNMFQIQNWGILIEADKTTIIAQKQILKSGAYNSYRIGTLVLFFGLSLVIFSFYILIKSTKKIVKTLLIVVLIFVILITSYLIYILVPAFIKML